MTTKKFAIAALLAAALVPTVGAQEIRDYWQAIKAGLPAVEIRPVLVNTPTSPTFVADFSRINLKRMKSVLGVVNDTGWASRDHLVFKTYLEVKIQQDYVATLAHGEDWHIHYDNGSGRWWWYGYGGYPYWSTSDNLIITVSACTDVAKETQLLVPADVRLMDATIVGPDALTAEYLSTKPGEDALDKKADKIREYLEKKKTLGRKDLRTSLKNFLGAAKKEGLSLPNTRCIDPVSYGKLVTVNRNAANGTEAHMFFVRGEWPKLYISENQ